MQGQWQDSDLCLDVFAGEWIRDGLAPDRTYRVSMLVPRGFAAYGRILHPLESVDDNGRTRWLRWSDLARATGAIEHAGIQLVPMLDRVPTGLLYSADRPVPATPVLAWEQQLDALEGILAQHTSTPDDCYFAFWEGNTAFEDIPDAVPRLEVRESFRCYLIRGPIRRIADTLHGLLPNLAWPADRAWCVVSNSDVPSTYIGATKACLEDVLHTDVLEAWAATIDDRITSDSDECN
ncbi:hypothetical protein [Aldersonia kunmingensis]|uniref:hypothetical protein n=1 Tax=Aldersonia kunmingensis TaxID=408066 RepID=UPI0012ED9F4D|nr:hypothetical protein [Aldersonia kunmingensis]